MFILIPLFAIALSLGALGASFEARLPRTPSLDLCPAALSVDSRTIAIGEHVIQHSTFLCTDDSFSIVASAHTDGAPIPGPATGKASNIRRTAAECKSSVPECQCGQATSLSCKDWLEDAPTGDDCAILLDGLQLIAEQAGATFLVPNNTLVLLTYQTCSMEFLNTGSFKGASSIEYCWDELRSGLGVGYQVCVESGKATGVENAANNGFWNQQIFRNAP